MTFSAIRLLLIPAFCGLLPLAAHAQWTADSVRNTVVRDSINRDEVAPLVAPGPAGSTYISWFESVPGTNYELRMQRLDAAGRPMWAPSGLVVSAQPQSTGLFRYDLKTDRAGDALVAFQDERTGTLQPVITKVAADGSLPWGTGIVLLDPLATSGLGPVIGVTNTNNVVVAWNASASGPGWVATQKFSPSGSPLWAAPYRVRDAGGVIGYTRPAWVAAGTDDAVLFYIEQTGRFPFISHVFAQRLTPTATVAWTVPVTPSNGLPFAFFPTPVSDQNDGAYLVYNTGNPANQNLTTVFAQHLLGSGAVAWPPDGIELITGTSTNRYAASNDAPTLRANGDLDVVFTVQDINQTQGGIALQRLDAAGNRLLGAGGQTLVPISAALHRAQGLQEATTGEGIAVFTTGGGLTQTLSAVGIDAAGAPSWTVAQTRAVSAATSGKDDCGLTPIRGTQLVVGWADNRTGGTGIYAQTIDLRGRRGGDLPTAVPALVAEAVPGTVWPNPGTTARLRLPLSGPATLTLRDAVGRLVREQRVMPLGTELDTQLPTEGLPAGLYMIQVQDNNQRQLIRWVKQ